MPDSPSTTPFVHTITSWPHAVGGFTARGDHDSADPESGCNLGHTQHADHEAVDRRRQQALRDLGIPVQTIVCTDQVHGTNVSVARSADLPQLEQRFGYPYYPQSDALITAEPGLALMLYFADCCPVWLYCSDPLCGGLAHCGWRGTVSDMTGAAVAALKSTFGALPRNMHAVVGPSICAACYEVGPEVVEAVENLDALQSVSCQYSRPHLDLPGLNATLLRRHGLPESHISVVHSCTRCGSVPLYSWRRDGAGTGRMAGFFALR